ncbi:splicing factor [Fusarium albosuccineum]|uniref:Splicing factor n=1 Tax=Fusarium albosuccineum TaxID=1237068 RepID=A0A8H4KZV9_9HYPO|nr:splicing factor [Fusarium albosuccineum]
MATKEKKEKKSKSSRSESKAEKPEKAAKIEKPQSTDDDVDMAETQPTPSSKRKIEIEEIEVDVNAPEPPSKRAKRALKKGKALPPKQDSDDETKGDKEAKEKKDTTRSEHGVWIGNLPFYVTPVELRKWLVDNSGEVISDEMMTRVKLPTNKEPGRDKNAKPTNKGFAYVDFTDIGPKVAAIALSETELGGRKLLIKDATSFEGRPKKEPEPAKEEDAAEGKTQSSKEQKKEENASRKIFVGNMSFKTTQDDLQRNFEKCGEIEWAKVATFEDTGKCKGFGWVKFKEPEAAAWAVKGFVKIKEQVETEDDFKGDDDSDKDEPRQKQFKTRKWWVNRMLGRELKIELAEDDQVRYKKRFGKDRKANGDNSNPRGRPPPRRYDQADGGAQDAKGSGEGEVKPLKEAEDISVARLTGAVVKHTGTKMTFD